MLLVLNRLESGTGKAASLMGGGVVSTELSSSCISDEENPGDADDPSLGSIIEASISDWPAGKLSAVMLHRTDAASKS